MPEITIRERRRMATREQILDAATELLSRDGYAALRLAAVAQQAKVSLGGQVHHFPSKETLVLAVLDRLWSHVMETAKQDAADMEDPDMASRLVLCRIAESARRFYGSPEFLIYLDIFLSVRRGTAIGEAAIAMIVAQRAAVENLWLPHLVSRGMADEDALLKIRAIWALARGLAISSQPSDHSEQDLLVMDLIVEALGAEFNPTH